MIIVAIKKQQGKGEGKMNEDCILGMPTPREQRGRQYLQKDRKGGAGEHKAPKVQASESQGRGQFQED